MCRRLLLASAHPPSQTFFTGSTVRTSSALANLLAALPVTQPASAATDAMTDLALAATAALCQEVNFLLGLLLYRPYMFLL